MNSGIDSRVHQEMRKQLFTCMQISRIIVLGVMNRCERTAGGIPSLPFFSLLGDLSVVFPSTIFVAARRVLPSITKTLIGPGRVRWHVCGAYCTVEVALDLCGT